MCLRSAIQHAIRSSINYPVRICCAQHSVNVEDYRAQVNDDALLGEYKQKEEEFMTPPEHRIYCSNPTCSSFLNRSQFNRGSVGTCFLCHTKTCGLCKNKYNGKEHRCSAAAEDEEALRVAFQVVGAKPCKCGALLEWVEACSFVRCPNCSRHFCFICEQEGDLPHGLDHGCPPISADEYRRQLNDPTGATLGYAGRLPGVDQPHGPNLERLLDTLNQGMRLPDRNPDDLFAQTPRERNLEEMRAEFRASVEFPPVQNAPPGQHPYQLNPQTQAIERGFVYGPQQIPSTVDPGRRRPFNAGAPFVPPPLPYRPNFTAGNPRDDLADPHYELSRMSQGNFPEHRAEHRTRTREEFRNLQELLMAHEQNTGPRYEYMRGPGHHLGPQVPLPAGASSASAPGETDLPGTMPMNAPPHHTPQATHAQGVRRPPYNLHEGYDSLFVQGGTYRPRGNHTTRPYGARASNLPGKSRSSRRPWSPFANRAETGTSRHRDTTEQSGDLPTAEMPPRSQNFPSFRRQRTPLPYFDYMPGNRGQSSTSAQAAYVPDPRQILPSGSPLFGAAQTPYMRHRPRTPSPFHHIYTRSSSPSHPSAPTTLEPFQRPGAPGPHSSIPQAETPFLASRILGRGGTDHREPQARPGFPYDSAVDPPFAARQHGGGTAEQRTFAERMAGFRLQPQQHGLPTTSGDAPALQQQQPQPHQAQHLQTQTASPEHPAISGTRDGEEGPEGPGLWRSRWAHQGGGWRR